jgi:calcineurin-like phosphoesterase family protein
MIWFTGDWHLDHEAIIDLASRPFLRMKHMEKTILKNYKEIVKKDDTVYFLGDIFFHKNKPKIESTLRNLPGTKILILGNHDKLDPFEYQELGFYQVATWLKVDNYTLVHDPAIAGCLTDQLFVCGHIHNLFKIQKNVINVGVDVWDFRPVSIDMICGIFKGEVK